jgi:hypothetical protein
VMLWQRTLDTRYHTAGFVDTEIVVAQGSPHVPHPS